jgi:hypothetical protein
MKKSILVISGLLISQLVMAGQITMTDPQQEKRRMVRRFAPMRTASMFSPTSLKGSARMQRLSIPVVQSKSGYKNRWLF